jgi:hypothetical protein
MKKILKYIKFLWVGLILGMKATEDETLHQSGLSLDEGSTVNQQVSDHSVAKALLRGELTQEVIELRYRTYAVAREASHYNYFSPTLAKKKGVNDFKFIEISNDENREIVTVQENKLEVETVNDALHRIGDDGKYVDRVKQYNIKFSRDNQPRFRIEDYAKKIVVFKGDDEYTAIIDVYVSKYPDDKIVSSKPFIRELEKIIDTGVRSDIFDLKTIQFETYKAYRLDDMINFEFGDPQLVKIFEFDGDYVIELMTNIIDGGTDLTEEFYDERMAKKYENKEAKETCITYDPNTLIRTYKCADCGKEVTYDARNLDKLDASDASTDGSATEFLDYEMAEATFGRMLCKDCMEKAQHEMYEKFLKKKN